MTENAELDRFPLTVVRDEGWAISIISNVDAPEAGWPHQTQEWRDAARNWLDSTGRPLPVDDDLIPWWAEGGDHNCDHYTEAELFVAGALSTMPPFASAYSPCALPFARRALEAMGEWVPSDD